MEELEVSWLRAATIWWSIFWRSLLYATAGGAIAGLVAGLVLAALGRADLLELRGQLVGLLVAVPAGIWSVRSVIGMEYRQFRIVLVPSSEARLERSLREKDG